MKAATKTTMTAAELETLIQRAGVRPSALAPMLNVTPAAVSNWLRGKARITSERAAQLRPMLKRLAAARAAAEAALEAQQ